MKYDQPHFVTEIENSGIVHFKELYFIQHGPQHVSAFQIQATISQRRFFSLFFSLQQSIDHIRTPFCVGTVDCPVKTWRQGNRINISCLCFCG